ncbi:hypothetical protein ES703_26206 [subsurface metagenome]
MRKLSFLEIACNWQALPLVARSYSVFIDSFHYHPLTLCHHHSQGDSH